jgi:hypothetical protein
MQINGYRIHVVGLSASRPGGAKARSARGSRKTDSADARSLSWLTLEPEVEHAPSAALLAAVQDGSYWVPAPEVSRALAEEHVNIRP